MLRLLIILGIILLILGFLGDFLPILPGPLLSYLALISLQIADKECFTTSQLVILGIVMVIVTAIDYITPIIGTKKMGGTKRGTRGSTIGLIVGVIVLPIFGIVIGPFGLIGLLGGPFLGAYIGEIMYQKKHPVILNEVKNLKKTKKDSSAKTSEGQITINNKKALKAAFGSFIGFLGGILLKFIYTIVVAIYFVPRIWFSIHNKDQLAQNYREIREIDYNIPQFKVINHAQYYKIKFEDTKASYSTGGNWIKWFSVKDTSNDQGSCHINNKPISVVTEKGKLFINIVDTCGGGSGDGYISKMKLKNNGKLKLVGCYRYDNRGQFETEENDENGNRYFEGTTKYERLNKTELSDCDGNFVVIYYNNIK